MFRGGRVDARGTGIASGLGYKKGGSVNTPKRGLVDGPGGYQGWKPPVDAGLLSQADKVQNWLTPEYLEKQFRREYYLDEDQIDYIDPATMGMQGMAASGAMYGGQPNLIKDSEFDIKRNQILENPGNYDFLLNKWVADNYGKQITSQGEILDAIGDTDTKLFTPRKLPGDTGEDLNGELTLAEQRTLLEQEYADKTAAFLEDQLSKGTPEEEIEKNKKIFQKAYGSGVADDASSMLMNLAGKMLKPEATVKSGFGEFFEEEGKRPSERKKYKDAATTAAINAYLTGQSSFKKFEDELGLYSKKLGMKTKADKATLQDMTIGQHKATISGAGKSDSQLTKAATENYIASQPEDKGKILNTFSSKKDPLEKLEVEENVNEYFIDSDTKHVYKIIIVDGEVTSKRLY